MRDAWMSMIAAPYAGLIRSRAWLYRHGWFAQRRLPRPVVSVGNLTVGGTGKTPMAMWVAGYLASRGQRVAVLSRGYRRTSRQPFVLVSDGRSLLAGPREAGDEPYLTACRCPEAVVAVGANRYRLGRWVLQQTPVDCFVLDDGFQHVGLARDVNLLLLDSADTHGLRALLPAGMLREPLEEARRASDVILTRVEHESAAARITAVLKEAAGVVCDPITTRFAAEALTGALGAAQHPLSSVRGKRALVFSGIGHPEQFRRMVDTLGVHVVGELVFRDHEAYAPSTIRTIDGSVARNRPDVALTTEKDLVKVRPRWSAAVPVFAVSIVVEFVRGRRRLEEALSALVRAPDT